MPYRSLFSLKVHHPYYLSKECPDFSIRPTAECEQRLKNYRLLWRSRPAGFQVAAQMEGGRLALPLPNGLGFSFFLKLQNPDFFNFTDLDTRQAVFYNLPGEARLSLREFFHTDHFQLADGMKAGEKLAFRLSRKPKDGFRPEGLVFTAPDSVKMERIARDNTIIIDPNGETEGRFSVKYPVSPALPWGTFGRVDITVHDAAAFTDFSDNGPDNHFELAFQPRAFFWKYWMIAEFDKSDTSVALSRQELKFGEETVRFVAPENGFDLGEAKEHLTESNFNTKIQEEGGGMEEEALERFFRDVKAVEEKISLPQNPRFYCFSEKAIPCREKYGQYPSLSLTAQEGGFKPDITLRAPAFGLDQTQVLWIRDQFADPPLLVDNS